MPPTHLSELLLHLLLIEIVGHGQYLDGLERLAAVRIARQSAHAPHDVAEDGGPDHHDNGGVRALEVHDGYDVAVPAALTISGTNG